MRRIPLCLLVCLALFMGACGTQASSDPVPDVASDPPAGSTDAKGGGKKAAAPENPAPDFAVTTFAGERFALAEQRGSPVVLNFWESW
jgi:cytochrome oxidase Cu insertion factor (SCO1/SenC/PrrC family)